MFLDQGGDGNTPPANLEGILTIGKARRNGALRTIDIRLLERLHLELSSWVRQASVSHLLRPLHSSFDYATHFQLFRFEEALPRVSQVELDKPIFARLSARRRFPLDGGSNKSLDRYSGLRRPQFWTKMSCVQLQSSGFRPARTYLNSTYHSRNFLLFASRNWSIEVQLFLLLTFCSLSSLSLTLDYSQFVSLRLFI